MLAPLSCQGRRARYIFDGKKPSRCRGIAAKINVSLQRSPLLMNHVKKYCNWRENEDRSSYPSQFDFAEGCTLPNVRRGTGTLVLGEMTMGTPWHMALA